MQTSSIAARLANAGRKGVSNAGVDARPPGGVSLMRTGYMAIGLAAAVSVVPASFAQGSRVPDQGKSAGTANNMGISLAVPIGKVRVGPESMDGEPVYERRTTVRPGITIVEVSTTPLMPNEQPPGKPNPIARPDQPASW